MAMHRTLHSHSDADRLCIPWNSGEGGMISVKDYVAMEKENLKKTTKRSGRRRKSRNEKTKKEVMEARNKNFMEKSLHIACEENI